LDHQLLELKQQAVAQVVLVEQILLVFLLVVMVHVAVAVDLLMVPNLIHGVVLEIEILVVLLSLDLLKDMVAVQLVQQVQHIPDQVLVAVDQV
jgi:hypothetical protein